MKSGLLRHCSGDLEHSNDRFVRAAVIQCILSNALAANGGFEPKLPIFYAASKACFRDNDKVASGHTVHYRHPLILGGALFFLSLWNFASIAKFLGRCFHPKR